MRWLRTEASLPGVFHAFSCREEPGGVLPPLALDLRFGPERPPEELRPRWTRVLHALGLEGRPVLGLAQIHGARVRRVGAPRGRPSPEPPVGDMPRPRPVRLLGEGDGLWTTEPGVVLSVSTADCVPVLLAGAGQSRWCAALHAGWRGLCQGVIAACVAALRAAGLFRPMETTALVGPAVGPCCYEVGPEVVEALARLLPGRHEEVLRPGKGGRPRADLVAAVRRVLREEGLPDESILETGLCTSCASALFWSHRRDGLDRGGMASMIMLEEGVHGS